MSAPTKSPSDASHHSDTLRKRVGKACDRCRLKKSKCDGSSPCSRCRIDNAICVFGERKKSHDKVYPKGYVEMLEQQQSQLVAGLQETYRRLMSAKLWPGAPLEEHEGHPLTHDILTTLDIIHLKDDVSDHFEEDTERLQQRLVAQGAPYIHRRGSFSSDSDHSVTHSHKRARSIGADTPLSSPVQKTFRASFEHDATSASPPVASPKTIPSKTHNPRKPSPLHSEDQIAEAAVQVDEDSLIAGWSWQDLPAEGLTSQEPQFTFPADDSAMLTDPWPNMPVPDSFDPTFMAAYPPGLNFNFDFPLAAAQQTVDFDMGYSVPVAS
ncbi:hypothetical protein ANO11243_033480 [Dothideomycetidae sp. 11243]|nr:hypothetical protein ANO11243_033480 [fungal sp. No.11243]